VKAGIVSTAVADFDKSSAFVTSACASAAGWSADIHDPRAAVAKSVLQYVWDSATGWIWVCSVPCEPFARASVAASRESGAGVDAIRGNLGHAIWRAATGQATDPAPGVSWMVELASLLASYAGTTQVWQVTNRLQDGGHFIVLYYRESAQPVGMLRPFALPVSARGRDVLPVGELLEVIRSVSATDRRRHPEWFTA
jgi:hypothetical protein